MNKEYVMISRDIIDALDQIENFKASMKNFCKIHPGYNMDIKLEGNEDNWKVRVKVNKDG